MVEKGRSSEEMNLGKQKGWHCMPSNALISVMKSGENSEESKREQVLEAVITFLLLNAVVGGIVTVGCYILQR